MRLDSMYFWAILILSLCAAASSYATKSIPYPLFAALILCIIFDFAVKKLQHKPFSASSAAITGLIIGGIAPLSIPAVVFASFVAITSKHMIKIKGRHVFNPAAFGLFIGLSAFGLGDLWWAASGFSILAVPLTLFLVIPNWLAGKLRLSLCFLAVLAALYLLSGLVEVHSLQSAFSLIAGLPFYFAFIMLSEPRTSPNAATEQLIFGGAAALLVFTLEFTGISFPSFMTPYLLSLLALNLAFAVYRSFRK